MTRRHTLLYTKSSPATQNLNDARSVLEICFVDREGVGLETCFLGRDYTDSKKETPSMEKGNKEK